MCIELFVNHALLFVSNCTIANLTNVSDTFDMALVYETYTTVAPFISQPHNTTDNTTTAHHHENITNNPIYGPYVYAAIIGPVIALLLIWCATAYARAKCTPCKPKKPKKPKKPTESCCCNPKKVKPNPQHHEVSPV